MLGWVTMPCPFSPCLGPRSGCGFSRVRLYASHFLFSPVAKKLPEQATLFWWLRTYVRTLAWETQGHMEASLPTALIGIAIHGLEAGWGKNEEHWGGLWAATFIT